MIGKQTDKEFKNGMIENYMSVGYSKKKATELAEALVKEHKATEKKLKKRIEKEFFSIDSGDQDEIINNYQYHKNESWLDYDGKSMSDAFAIYLSRKGFGMKKRR